MIVDVSQAEAASEWTAIAASVGSNSASEPGHPDDEFLNAASKLQVWQATYPVICKHTCRHVCLFLQLISASPHLQLDCMAVTFSCTLEEVVLSRDSCQSTAARLQVTAKCMLKARTFECLVQARLVLGVRAELDACKEALLRLYRRCAMHACCLSILIIAVRCVLPASD